MTGTTYVELEYQFCYVLKNKKRDFLVKKNVIEKFNVIFLILKNCLCNSEIL